MMDNNEPSCHGCLEPRDKHGPRVEGDRGGHWRLYSTGCGGALPAVTEDMASCHRQVLLILFGVVIVLSEVGVVTAAGSQILIPSWQQYYPFRKWSFFDEQVHGRPPRVRVGQGRYRLLPGGGADLICDFPPHLRLVSNVVWERADLGDGNSLNRMYRTFGLPHEFTVHMRPTGSTLNLRNTGPLDKGLYRCLASAQDIAASAPHRMPPSLTVFQDIEYFPSF